FRPPLRAAMDPAADDGRSPSPVTDPDDGDGGSDKPPTRVEVVGKAAMEPSPSPPDSTVSDDQVALSSPPGTPALDPEDGGGSDDLTRAVSLLSLAEAGLTLTAPAPWIRPPTVTKGDQVSDSEATVVLVVPQPCCGMLIGKGGSVINQKLQ
uniref:K Homology domain-containing protein n=3 Tax=Triticinae TaxID=1648030 RepID=A0A453TEI4_AEGTS